MSKKLFSIKYDTISTNYCEKEQLYYIPKVILMNNKQITVNEVNNIIEDIFSEYIDKYDKMSFSEIAIVENILIKLQYALDKKYGENIKDYDRNLLKEFVLFYKEFDGYENSSELRESELDLIDLFLGERYG